MCSRKSSRIIPMFISPAPITTRLPATPQPPWPTCRRRWQLDPKRSDSYLNLALLQMRGQQWDAAEASFKKAADLSPKSTTALHSPGKLLSNPRALSGGGAGFPAGDRRRAGRSQPPALSRQPFMAENKRAEPKHSCAIRRKISPPIPSATACSAISITPTTSSTKPPKNTERSITTIRKDLLVKKNYIQLLILKDRLDDARKLNDEVLKAKPDDERRPDSTRARSRFAAASPTTPSTPCKQS